MDKIELMKEIIGSHSYKEIEGTIIDVQTANAIITVYEALGEENKQKFTSHNISTMANIAWKLVN